MGWCSATEIFDSVAGFVLKADAPKELKFEVLKKLADALEDQDWDCQEDSAYYNYPLVESVFRSLHPDWDFGDADDE